VIQALQEKIQVPWTIAYIIEDIHIWHSQGIRLLINHVFRETDTAAD